MARRKISRAKLESVRQGKQISEIFGEALGRHLADAGSRRAMSGVAAESWGALKLDRRRVRRLLRDEYGLFDA